MTEESVDYGSLRIFSAVPGVVTIEVRSPWSKVTSSITIPWEEWLELKEVAQPSAARLTPYSQL